MTQPILASSKRLQRKAVTVAGVPQGKEGPITTKTTTKIPFPFSHSLKSFGLLKPQNNLQKWGDIFFILAETSKETLKETLTPMWNTSIAVIILHEAILLNSIP